jgi:hypothetical protein
MSFLKKLTKEFSGLMGDDKNKEHSSPSGMRDNLFTFLTFEVHTDMKQNHTATEVPRSHSLHLMNSSLPMVNSLMANSHMDSSQMVNPNNNMGHLHPTAALRLARRIFLLAGSSSGIRALNVGSTSRLPQAAHSGSHLLSLLRLVKVALGHQATGHLAMKIRKEYLGVNMVQNHMTRKRKRRRVVMASS